MGIDQVHAVAEALGLGRHLAYRPEEAARILRLGRRQTYEAIRTGRLRAARNGARLLVPVSAIAAFLDGENPARGEGGER